MRHKMNLAYGTKHLCSMKFCDQVHRNMKRLRAVLTKTP